LGLISIMDFSGEMLFEMNWVCSDCWSMFFICSRFSSSKV
jgi:hypothetical protein